MEGIGAKPRLRAHANDNTVLISKEYARMRYPTSVLQSPRRGGGCTNIRTLSLLPSATASFMADQNTTDPSSLIKACLQIWKNIRLSRRCISPVISRLFVRFLERFPDLPQIACFDTAFHRSHSAVADHFAIPEQFYVEGVRRYGFHGLSYEYVAERLRQIAPDMATKRVIIAHLGSGASMCALSNSRSIDSTMGFTALDGLPMGTRPGQIDPGVVLYLVSEKCMTPTEVEDLLYRQSGLKGLSGISSDVRELIDSKDHRARFALDYFVYRSSQCVGMLVAALGGLDAFVFTAGVGENSAVMRARIAEKLSWLGARLDSSANAAGKTLISESGSPVALYVIATDEELMIARHTLAVLSARRPIQSVEDTISA